MLKTTSTGELRFENSIRSYVVEKNGWIALRDGKSSVLMHEEELKHIVDELRAKETDGV